MDMHNWIDWRDFAADLVEIDACLAGVADAVVAAQGVRSAVMHLRDYVAATTLEWATGKAGWEKLDLLTWLTVAATTLEGAIQPAQRPTWRGGLLDRVRGIQARVAAEVDLIEEITAEGPG